MTAKRMSRSLTPEQRILRKAKRVGLSAADWLALSEEEREKRWTDALTEETARRVGMTAEEWKRLDKVERTALRKKVSQQRKQERAVNRAKRDAEALRAAAKARSKPVKGLRNLTVNLSVKRPPTGVNFIYMLKQAVLAQKETPSPVYRKMLDSVLMEFDKYYRPFIYKFLLTPVKDGGLGFESRYVKIGSTAFAYVPFRGDVSAEDVFTDVWLKLFGDVSKQVRRAQTGKGESGAPALMKFDERTERLGAGTFGCYIKYIARSVYFDQMRKDLVPETDRFGKVMYRRDRNGKILLDKKGRKIPRLVPRCQLGDKEDYASTENFKDAVSLMVKPEEHFQRSLTVEIACLAYVSVHERNVNSWFYRAATELYERSVPTEEVIMGCIGRGDIRDRRAYDMAVSRFRMAMRKERDRIRSEIDKAVRRPDKNRQQVLGERELLALKWKKLSEKFGKRRVHEMRERFMSAAGDA